MNILLDTHILLWAAAGRLPKKAECLMTDGENILFFSSVSIWEIAMKSELGRNDFSIDIHILYRELIEHQYRELSVMARHAIMAQSLPNIHKDPFDRLLLAQATVEGYYLLTSDYIMKKYPGPIIYIPSTTESC